MTFGFTEKPVSNFCKTMNDYRFRVVSERENIKELLKDVPVAHTCNPSCSGGRDQEAYGLKSDQQIIHETLSRKKSHHKKG
jgi:hypothetical protein